MSWFIQKHATQEELAKHLLDLVKDDRILKIPGTHDGMAALVAKNVGFEALYLSGAAFTASKGLPDLAVMNSTELADQARDLIRAVNLPVIVDIDTGFGGVLNTIRTVLEMYEAKVAAVQIEDQKLPKKCGHLDGKQLVTIEEMIQKIKAIKEVVSTLLIIARTDAVGVEGIESGIKRAQAYAEAGADIIFTEALTSEEEFTLFRKKVNAPLLANMTEFGKTPYFSAAEFEKMGYNVVIYPVTSLRVAAKAYERIFLEIMEKGTQKEKLNEMQTRKELYETIHYFDYEELDQRIAKTSIQDYYD